MEQKKTRLAELEEKTADPALWDNGEEARTMLQELSVLQAEVGQDRQIIAGLDDIEVILQLTAGGGDEAEKSEMLQEAAENLQQLKQQLSRTETELQFSGEHDNKKAIVSIHPGAGGLESQDWAEMLMRMYLRWAEKKGMEAELLDLLSSDEAGIKSVTFSVNGPYAYGYLKSEKGVHRMVRISPFDTASRRHTSFASVDVIPEADEEEEVVINPDDLRIDTYRASGAGGQHVNKTDSAVRVTHLPTGLVAQSQNDRSQHSNRAQALRILQARLAAHQREQTARELDSIRGEQKEIAWGSQIRSYTFHPFTLVKDHRTNLEVGNAAGVMDGDLDALMEAYLRLRCG